MYNKVQWPKFFGIGFKPSILGLGLLKNGLKASKVWALIKDLKFDQKYFFNSK
jgi:hypothetical protein